MVGKTNLTFISKGDASSVQLIQKSYITDSNGIIWKMEIINGKIFAFSDKNVMMGTSMENLEFLKKGQEYLRADHIIYKNGRYYLVEADVECEIYTTEDFVEYGKVELGEGFSGKKNVGIFLDSSGMAIFVSYKEKSDGTTDWNIYRCDMIEDLLNTVMVTGNFGNAWYKENHTYMLDNKIFWYRGNTLYQVSLSGGIRENIHTKDFEIFSYAAGYFFYNIGSNPTKMYRSRDAMSNETLCPDVKSVIINNFTCAIPMNGKIGILYNSSTEGGRVINVADDILSVGRSTNVELQCSDKVSARSVMEYDGKTYVGTNSGIIYEFSLDYEGIIQRPDVAIIKTLAAKQALEQSLQYTDDCIAKLKNYIDSKMGEEAPAIEDNSTEVES